MSVLNIIEWPDPVLETKAELVTAFDAGLKKLVADMKETMGATGNTVGLAANQVNVLKRILVIRVGPKDEDPGDNEEAPSYPWHNKTLVLINPVLTSPKGRVRSLEGCLSFPDCYEWIDRFEEVTVTACDEDGKSFTIEAKGFLPIVVQHEVDHLDGVVMVDRVSRLKANLLRKKMQKRHRRQLEEAE